MPEEAAELQAVTETLQSMALGVGIHLREPVLGMGGHADDIAAFTRWSMRRAFDTVVLVLKYLMIFTSSYGLTSCT